MKWKCQIDGCDVEGDAADAPELDEQYAEHYKDAHARQGVPASVAWADEGGNS